MRRAVPDWQRPISTAAEAFAVLDRSDVAMAMPIALSLAERAPGQPEFRLDVTGMDAAVGEDLLQYGTLDFRLVIGFRLPERQAAAFAANPLTPKLIPAVPSEGWLWFNTPESLELPDALGLPQSIQGSGGNWNLSAFLEASAAASIEEMLTGGLSPVGASALLGIKGWAPRFPAVILFDGERLSELLLQLSRGGHLKRSDVARALEDDGSVVEIVSAAWEEQPPDLFDAIAERLLAHFACAVPGKANVRGGGDISIERHIAYELTGPVPERVRWELERPVLVTRYQRVQSDPLEMARRALEAGHELIRRHRLPAIDSGFRNISVHVNLPENCAGLLALNVDLRFPVHPPERPNTTVVSQTIKPGQRRSDLEVRLSPGELLRFEYRTVCFIQETTGARAVSSAWSQHEGAHLVLTPGDFPFDLVTLEAEPALLRLATIEIECRGNRESQEWSTEVELTKEKPTVSIVLPEGLRDGRFRSVGQPLSEAEALELDTQDLEDRWLTLSDFPNYGPQATQIVCDFDDNADRVSVECQRAWDTGAEGGIARITLTPQDAQRQWTWLATNPFASGFRCRWALPDAPWSPVLPANAIVHFRSSQRHRSPTPMEQAEGL